MSSGRSLFHSTSIKLFVDEFMNQHLSGKIEVVELKKLSHKVAKYVVQLSEHFDIEQTENLLLSSIENFKILLPKEVHKYFPSKEIIYLLENVIQIVNSNKDDMDQNILINSIIQNAIHSLEKGSKTTNYAECILYELLKELIISIHIEDIPQVLDHIIYTLSSLTEFNAESINVNRLAKQLLEHASSNFIEELNMPILTELIEHIVNGLLHKT